MSWGTEAIRFPAPSKLGLGLGAGEGPPGVSDSVRSNQRLDFETSDPGEFEASAESFLHLETKQFLNLKVKSNPCGHC
jgi:hypothetical protein